MARQSTITTTFIKTDHSASHPGYEDRPNIYININNSSSSDGSTGRGILIGMLSAFGSATFVVLLLALVYFFRYTSRGRILLDRIGRPGQYDDEQALLREEAEAMETMDEMERAEYLRAKAFILANPPETMQTDISLSQFLAIQEKGVSAWEFEPELEIANCFVEARTEIEFFDSECSVQSNLPIPKQNEVYYWEAKIYDKPDSSLISIGVTTKPYPLFRLPGLHRTSIAYISTGDRRYNQPFSSTPYSPEYVQGDVIGVGYRPRIGTIFFTRNGKKLDDIAHGLKTQNFFPTVGASGPCTVHVNFGQSGFVFIEANVKKWGLAPASGSLAPPPPYGSEQGSILLETGRDGAQTRYPSQAGVSHTRSRSRFGAVGNPMSPGPVRSPTEISLAHLAHIPSQEDVGEGTSRNAGTADRPNQISDLRNRGSSEETQPLLQDGRGSSSPPPEYESPVSSPGATREDAADEHDGSSGSSSIPQVPSYDTAMAQFLGRQLPIPSNEDGQ